MIQKDMKKQYTFFLERDMVACLQYALHIIETREQNKHYLRSGIPPFKEHVLQENNGEA